MNHLGVWAKDLNPTRAKLLAGGNCIRHPRGAQFIDLPNGLRLEFIDDPAGPELPAAGSHPLLCGQRASWNSWPRLVHEDVWC